MKKRILSLALALIMALAILPAVSMAASDLVSPVGMDMSQMNTTDLQGNTVTGELFSQYQLTLINAWATWCGPCKNEMPYFQKLHEEYESMGVKMVGLLIEDGTSTLAGGINYMASSGFTYTCVRMDSALRSLYSRGVSEYNGIPQSYLVDNEGKVVSAKVGGFVSYNEVENWILKYWKNPILEGVTLPESAEVGVNRMITLVPELKPVYALVDEMTWTSSNEQVATVSEGGIVTGLSEGVTLVSVTVKSGEEVTLKAECLVTVKASEELPENTTLYTKTDTLADGHEYIVVVNYKGEYFMLAPEQAVDGRYRLNGTKALAENMVLVPVGEEGETELAFTKVANENLWKLEGDEENGYGVANLATGDYISTVRANGVYRLTLKSKNDTAFGLEDGKLSVMTDGHYTGDRKFVSYFAETENKFAPAFDLIDKDNELFTEVMFFEKTSGTNEPDPTPGPDDPNPSEPPVEAIPGDVNGNNGLDAGDATMVLRHVVGTGEPLTEEQIKIGDMNGNGSLDAGDATIILREVVGG